MEKVYLGDGAYCEYTGYGVRIYTSNGIEERDQVFLERNELLNLIEFIKRVNPKLIE